MKFERRDLSDRELKLFYQNLLFPRTVEERMLTLLRQGKIGKWFSGIGQEAISVGATMALKDEDHILPLHRNLGVFTTRGIPIRQLFAQWQGKASGFTKGRDRSFHFGTNDYNIVGMISHLGAMLGVADGISLSHRNDKNNLISMAFTGDGGTSEGDFHEALNVAAVWDLPVIFVIENNGYGLSTPTSEQYRCEHLVDRAKGYGIKGVRIDGNNILEVYHTFTELANEMRINPKPVLIECDTFRMRGHEEASGTKYVPQQLFDEWAKKDPLSNFEEYLTQEGLLTPDLISALKKEMVAEIDAAVKSVLAEEEITPNQDTELGDVFHPSSWEPISPDYSNTKEMRLVDAISDGLRQGMEMHENAVIMGQDIAEYGGVFKITDGFLEQFGRDRVRNTPICESAIVGAALGLSIAGKKAIMEMQFADFATCGFNQIVNNLAKTHYRWDQKVDVVIRMPTGAGVNAGPFHSQSNEAWFFHVPGLILLYPSNPKDAKGMMIAAINEPNPVLFFEHKAMYRSVKSEVPTAPYTIPIGKAHCVQEGSDVCIITYGLGVKWAIDAFEGDDEVEIIDLRTLIPWDRETVFKSVQKTGKVIVLHEDNLTGGIGAEISATINEHCFEYLDAPVKRLGSLDTPVPMAKDLEKQYLGIDRLPQTVAELKAY